MNNASSKNKIAFKALVCSGWFLCFVASGQPTPVPPHQPQPPTNSDFVARMAPHLLRCVPENANADCISTRVGAYLLLRMPYHASKSLESHRDVLDSTERAIFESNVARLITDQHKEELSFIAQYLPLARSSNKLFAAHLSNLANVGGAGPVTNLLGTELDLRFLGPELDKPIVVITISKDWLAELCSKGTYNQLVAQLSIVAELRRQDWWQVVVAISPSTSEKRLSVEILNRRENADSKSAPQLWRPAETFFEGTDEQRQIAVEDFILETLK